MVAPDCDFHCWPTRPFFGLIFRWKIPSGHSHLSGNDVVFFHFPPPESFPLCRKLDLIIPAPVFYREKGVLFPGSVFFPLQKDPPACMARGIGGYPPPIDLPLQGDPFCGTLNPDDFEEDSFFPENPVLQEICGRVVCELVLPKVAELLRWDMFFP